MAATPNVPLETTSDSSSNASLVTIHLQVTGMMCQRNCGSTVQRALETFLEDHNDVLVVEAGASFEESRAWVVLSFLTDDKSSMQEWEELAIEAVECVGFDASRIDNLEDYLKNLKKDAPSRLTSFDVEEATVITSSSMASFASLRVGGMSCAVCVGRVEQSLMEIPSVRSATVSLATQRAHVEFEGDDSAFLAETCCQTVEQLGYECEVLHTSGGGDDENQSGGMSLRQNADSLRQARQDELNSWKCLLIVSIVLTAPLYAMHRTAMQPEPTKKCLWTMWILATLAQVIVGGRYYKAAWKGLNLCEPWKSVLGMDFLVCLGTTASYGLSILVACRSDVEEAPMFHTGAMLLTFVTLGKYLETHAKGQTASSLQTLLELQPVFCTRLVGGHSPNEIELKNIGSLKTEDIPCGDIQVGDWLLVLPGSRIPTDGVVKQTTGTAVYVDESALSGEPFPVAKRVGDQVYGSTVNQLLPLIVEATQTGNGTVLAQICHLVEDAQTQKAPIQAVADRVASIFAPVVMLIATITFFAWIVCCDEDNVFVLATMSAISVVVVACPCALGLATPTAVMVGTGVGAKHGLFIKGGAVLEGAHAIDTLIFDKTGTLTTGKAVVGECATFQKELATVTKGGVLPSKVPPRDVALWLAACAEIQSEHPLGRAIVNCAKNQWGADVTCSQEGVKIQDFRVLPGCGVECSMSKPQFGSYVVRVGTKEWVSHADSEEETLPTVGDTEMDVIRRRGHVGIFVSLLRHGGGERPYIVGVLSIVDPIRAEARSTVTALQSVGVDVWLCTGDHEVTAAAVARDIGIDEDNVCAGVKPQGKADLVSRLQQRRARFQHRGGCLQRPRKGTVAFCGDGINDAVALARADVGIAIGAGTEVAVEAADMVLIRSSLHDVVVALHLSKVVFQRIRMNFMWAMSYNMIALPFAAGVMYPFTQFRLPPEYAGLMMAFSSVSVVMSSLLLRTYKRPVIDDKVYPDEGIFSKFPRRLSDTVAKVSPTSDDGHAYTGVATEEASVKTLEIV